MRLKEAKILVLFPIIKMKNLKLYIIKNHLKQGKNVKFQMIILFVVYAQKVHI